VKHWGIVVVALLLVTLVLAACRGGEPTPVPTAEATFESPLDMANPASKYCVDQGYKLEIRDEANGQVGYCIFPDGSECEEWAYFRGECSGP